MFAGIGGDAKRDSDDSDSEKKKKKKDKKKKKEEEEKEVNLMTFDSGTNSTTQSTHGNLVDLLDFDSSSHQPTIGGGSTQAQPVNLLDDIFGGGGSSSAPAK